MKLDILTVPHSEIERILSQLRPSKSAPDCLFLPSSFGSIVLNSPRVACVKVDGVWYQPYLHQLICEWHNGLVPRKKVVRHLCGFGACGNHEHLVIGTHQENRWDREFHREYGAGALAPRFYD